LRASADRLAAGTGVLASQGSEPDADELAEEAAAAAGLNSDAARLESSAGVDSDAARLESSAGLPSEGVDAGVFRLISAACVQAGPCHIATSRNASGCHLTLVPSVRCLYVGMKGAWDVLPV
jgi:hypothetical protein